MTIWSWLALLAIPVWIFVWHVVIDRLAEWSMGREWWRGPVASALAMPSILIALLGVVGAIIFVASGFRGIP